MISRVSFLWDWISDSLFLTRRKVVKKEEEREGEREGRREGEKKGRKQRTNEFLGMKYCGISLDWQEN